VTSAKIVLSGVKHNPPLSSKHRLKCPKYSKWKMEIIPNSYSSKYKALTTSCAISRQWSWFSMCFTYASIHVVLWRPPWIHWRSQYHPPCNALVFSCQCSHHDYHLDYWALVGKSEISSSILKSVPLENSQTQVYSPSHFLHPLAALSLYWK
jgi:hypothetical protein